MRKWLLFCLFVGVLSAQAAHACGWIFSGLDFPVVTHVQSLEQAGSDPSAYAYGQLRVALAKALSISVDEVRIDKEPGGRPEAFIRSSRQMIPVSVSHDRNWVAWAYSLTASGVGVDIESFDPDRKIENLMAAQVYSEEEMAILRGIADRTQKIEKAIQLFTQKEAATKALGRGIWSGLDLRDLVLPQTLEQNRMSVKTERFSPENAPPVFLSVTWID